MNRCSAARARIRAGLDRRCRDDDGAVLVEFALVAPLLVVILAGTIDFGIGFRNRIVIQGAVRNGARMAAVLGPDASADQMALSTMAAGLSDLTNATITKVIVFETDQNGAITSACTSITPSGSGSGVSSSSTGCNVYNATQVTNSSTTFVQAGSGCTTGWDRFYCPKNRSNQLTGPPDYLGVYMEINYIPLTKIFKTSFSLSDKVVVRIEPQAG